jgi:hypothetical protein
MGTTNINVNLVNGSATTDQNGAVTLDKDNDVTISVGSGFAGKTKVSALTLYEWDENKGNGQGSLIGSWTRANPTSQPSTDVSVDTDGDNIRVTDTDTVADTRFCYTATVNDSTGDHTTPDPELVVKKKKKN